MTDSIPGQSLLTLCWSNHRSTFPTTLSTFRRKELYCDVSLACGGRFYGAHRLVLSACSEYFDAMFQHSNCKHPIIVLKDVVPEDVEALLNYMYEGVATVAKQNLNRLIKSAEDLRIKGLALSDVAYCGGQDRFATMPLITNVGKATREGRTSPPHKKQRKEGNCTATSSSTQDFQQTTTQAMEYTTSKLGDHFGNRLRTRQESQRNHSTNKDMDKTDIFEDEIKTEEEISVLHKNDATLMTTYGLVVNESTVNHTIVQPSQTDQGVVTHRFEPTQVSAASHSQPLAEAVAEALAGPSGVQTVSGSAPTVCIPPEWLAPADLGTGSFTTVEAYSTDTGEVTTATPIQLETAPTVTVLSANPSEPNNTSVQVVTSLSSVPTTSSETSRSDGNLKCHYCHRDTFRQMSDLKRHIRIHTGEKPFKCTTCTYKASRRDLLQAHVSKMHPSS